MSPKVIRATPGAVHDNGSTCDRQCIPVSSTDEWMGPKIDWQKQAPVGQRPTGSTGFGTSALTGLSAILHWLRCTPMRVRFIVRRAAEVRWAIDARPRSPRHTARAR